MLCEARSILDQSRTGRGTPQALAWSLARWTSETVELCTVLSGHALIKDPQKSQAPVDINVIMKSLVTVKQGIIM